MATKRSGLPSFWVTDISRLLVGDSPCVLQPFVKGHYALPRQPESSAMATYKVRHTEMLAEERARLQHEGWKCSVEQFFRLTGTTAILSGKPDVIAQKADCRPKIVDTKSGEPRDSDIVQVCLYIIAIPLTWGRAMTFDGEVVYQDHRVFVPHRQAEDLKPKVFALLKKLGTMDQPEPSPSEGACRWCPVPEDLCQARWTEQTAPVLTSEF